MHIRPFREEDIDAVAAVLVKSWQAAYRGMIPDDHLNGLSVKARTERMRDQRARGLKTDMLVLCDETAVVGVVGTGTYSQGDLPSDTGEVKVFYLLPAYWGRGEGSRLLEAALRKLRAQPYRRIVLWVLKDNVRAQRAYERAGFVLDGAQMTKEIGGAPVEEVRYMLDLGGPVSET